jgi:hypothetical protein
LLAIARRCLETLQRFDRRTKSKSIKWSEVGWLKDEAAADVLVADSIDLMSIRSPEAVHLASRLQKQVRTGKRRFGYIVIRIRDRTDLRADTFEEPVAETAKIVRELEALLASL